MSLSVRKYLKVKPRGQETWKAGMEIDGFREEGTDLVVLDKQSKEVARYQASQYESWIVEARIEGDV